MYTITKAFAFSASHILLGLPEGHQCGRLHGHNYIVELVLSGTDLDERGFVFDYGDLAPVRKWIDDTFDHRHLNDVMGENSSTAENLARMIYWKARALLPGAPLSAVRVSETPKCWASYSPDGLTR